MIRAGWRCEALSLWLSRRGIGRQRAMLIGREGGPRLLSQRTQSIEPTTSIDDSMCGWWRFLAWNLPTSLPCFSRSSTVVAPDQDGPCLDQPGVLGDWATGRSGRGGGCCPKSPHPHTSASFHLPPTALALALALALIITVWAAVSSRSLLSPLATADSRMRLVGNICSNQSSWRAYSNH